MAVKDSSGNTLETDTYDALGRRITVTTGSPTTPVSATASFVGTDATTEGAWRSAYGSDGYDIAQDTSGTNPSLPSYAQVSVTGASNYTWGTNTGNPFALQNAAGNGDLAAVWYSNTSFDINIDLTDGLTHRVALYATDWNNVTGVIPPPPYTATRTEQFQVINATTGAVLDTETLSSFEGSYLVWNLQGDVTIRVTNVGSSLNAVVNAIFFGAAPSTTQHLYYSAQGQVIEERQDGTAAADVTHQYVWSLAYVNALVLRDTYQDGVLVPADRLYAQQDANYNTTALVNTSGTVVERYTYSPRRPRHGARRQWHAGAGQHQRLRLAVSVPGG